MSEKRRLYLEDVSIGSKFLGGPVTLSEEAIIAFASEFDPQPFHTDPEAAKATVFKGLAASGWHTACATMRLLVDGAMPFVGGSVGFGVEVAWPRPVRPGDALFVEVEILEIKPSSSKPQQATVTLKTTTTNQNGETVQVMTSKNLIFKRGHAPGESR